MENAATRRGIIIAALSATGAMALSAPAIAASAIQAPDRTAWEQSLAALQRLAREADACHEQWERVHAIWEAGRPSMDMIHWREFPFADRDWVARVMNVEERWQQFLDAEGKLWWAADREARIAQHRAALDSVLAYRKACDEHGRNTGYDAISDRVEAYGDALADAEAAQLNMPAPDGEALLWKLDKLFGEEACGGDTTPAWSREYVAQFMADCRRLLAGRA